MSVLFPKVNQPRGWDYRPIYYDPEKEKHQQRIEKARQMAKKKLEQSGENKGTEEEPYVSHIQRGTFREAHEANKSQKLKDYAAQRSRIAFWIALLVMLIFFMYYFF